MEMEKRAGEKAFCRAYLRRFDVRGAAREAGVDDGWALLRKKSVQKELERLRASGGVCREDVLRKLSEIVFGRANDAVKLALGAEISDRELDELELGALTEFKRGSNGAAEVKFVDRVKALELLCSLLGSDEGDAAEFLRALGEECGAWEN